MIIDHYSNVGYIRVTSENFHFAWLENYKTFVIVAVYIEGIHRLYYNKAYTKQYSLFK